MEVLWIVTSLNRIEFILKSQKILAKSDFETTGTKKVGGISAVVTKLNVNIAGSPSLLCSINPLLLNVVFPYTMAPLGSFQTPK